ncbi:hypothetical protein A3H26_02925 [candidate division WWE3 bacterium RIFCSPLOWO2_12_FULL_36_10]|uniref:ASCH domain-containing protein n=1 Tax=candidate division WWE3 bacterium RIFCSPLOWO2_12_FULL_36_10 TaxID=1802630 RepID=A0A1F4VKA7_UNCKA|nr:MAG: hypothetical protein A3H26_02925 [candidate division WWE3 bacterium RIFCSPLOWO2_12_FULL_36_10]
MQNEVLFSLKPKFAELIERKEKNYEFRKYTPKTLPVKIWFYVTSPVSALLYIAEVSPVIKYPTKINPNGYGNEDFNDGFKKAEYAFPIVHLYKLPLPLSLDELREDFGFTAPQGFAYMSKYPTLYKHVTKRIKLNKLY